MVTKVKISSFVNPAPEDIEALRSLTPEEQQSIIEEEIGKGFEGTPKPLTKKLSHQLFEKAKALRSSGNAPR